MPVARNNMGQKSHSGLIKRVRNSMHRSSKGSYSFAGPSASDSYAEVDQEVTSGSGPHNQEDYYQVSCRRDSNELHTGNHVNMNGTSHKTGHTPDTGQPLVNGTCSHATNGFHNPDDFENSMEFQHLVKRNGVNDVEENPYIQNAKSVENEENNSARYSVADNRDEEDHGNFESQGAKPKTHYSKNKNGLRDPQGTGAAWTKRQSAKQNNAKGGGQPPKNYLNVDMEEMRTVHEEDSRDVVNWSSTADEEILEALKGPVLPPLKLPPERQEQSCPAPKTPHIEIVYRKEDIGDEDLEELKFASRAIGFKINSDVALPPNSSTLTDRNLQGTHGVERRVSEGNEEPSNGGILLMSEREATQHQERATEGEENASPEKAADVSAEQIRINGAMGATPPFVDRTNKPVPRIRLEDELGEPERPVPPPIPPRSPAPQNYDSTHNEIQEFGRVPPHPRSLSLPRDMSPGFFDQTEDQSARGNRRKVLSTIFSRKSKRHSTFSERPLPAIPGVAPGNNISRNRAATMATDRRLPQPPPEEQPPPLLPKVPIKSPREVEEEQKLIRQRGEFASSLRKISDFGWYWGPMSWDDAETRLENTPDGSFLVRDSSDERHILSLSFRANGTTHHTRIEHQHGKFSFWSQPTSHGSTSVVDFIEEAMRHSHNGSFLYFLRPRMPGLAPAPVQLLYAISRFQKARSLQHMCRFVIRKNIRLDHIDRLPLPKRLKDYLSEAHYYTPEALEP